MPGPACQLISPGDHIVIVDDRVNQGFDPENIVWSERLKWDLI